MKKFFSILAGCALILSGCTTGIPDTVVVDVDLPTQVEVFEKFDMVVSVTNNDTVAHEIRSVDILEETFLDGVLIVDTNFPTTDEYNVVGYDIYEFMQMVQPGETVDVIFTANAFRAGNFGGEIDICIDGDGSCTTRMIDVIAQ